MPSIPVSGETAEESHSGQTWDRLVGSLKQAREALVAGDCTRAQGALASASSFVADLYGELDPVRTALATHIQALLETCMSRIEHARRHADVASIDATIQLLLPVRAALKPLTD
jgi:flagellin-specific chaperone FliS